MTKFHFYLSQNTKSKEFLDHFGKSYKNYLPSEADICIVVGGDGTLLRALQELPQGAKIFPLNVGKVGFLMNQSFDSIRSPEKLVAINIFPLEARIKTSSEMICLQAYNDVSFRRQGPTACHLKIEVNHISCLENLVGDGLIVSSPLGSTGYNYSAGGPILPVGSNVVALTPICSFSPRQWKGCILPHTSTIRIKQNEAHHRPISVTCDTRVLENVQTAVITQNTSVYKTLLFDPSLSLEERVLMTQFQHNTESCEKK